MAARDSPGTFLEEVPQKDMLSRDSEAGHVGIGEGESCAGKGAHRQRAQRQRGGGYVGII